VPTILLIRHGESQANAGLPTADPRDIELTERGREEARCVAQEIQRSYSPLDRIVVSAYQRAQQTAEYTRQYLKHPTIPIEIWPVQEFTYLSEWGKKSSTVEERRPTVLRYWEQANPTYTDGPDAESFQQFIERVRQARDRLRTVAGTVAVFSHHQFICALLWLSLQDIPPARAQTMREFKDFLDACPLANGTIVRVQYERESRLWQPEIVTSHLRLKECEQTGAVLSSPSDINPVTRCDGQSTIGVG